MRDRNEVVELTIENTPVKYRAMAKKGFEGKISPRSAIKLKCLECVGYVRDDVTHCTGYSCPLWRLRPFQARG